MLTIFIAPKTCWIWECWNQLPQCDVWLRVPFLQRHEPSLEEAQTIYDSLSKKTPTMKNQLETVQTKWESLWKTSGLYIERMKCVELSLSGLEEATGVVSELDTKLADYRRLPDDKEGLRSVHLSLVDIKNSLQKHQVSRAELLMSAPGPRSRARYSRDRLRNTYSPEP